MAVCGVCKCGLVKARALDFLFVKYSDNIMLIFNVYMAMFAVYICFTVVYRLKSSRK